ncbi:pyridoxine/pyridoxamine 5'-phosphate oxidase [Gryllotalpicola protaetiae]|nr:pyridoxamine 5'-phosphate oxidase family protein [Gryllotalpicola protaetiae]
MFGRDLEDTDASPADPLALLGMWLPDPADPVKPLMTLSTMGLDGYPDARTVLLSAFDGRLLRFHTDARSRKASELAAVPRATMTLVWPDAARQVVVTGDVAPEAPAEAAETYPTRSRALQLLAWLNTDELAARPAAERQAAWARFDAEHAETPLVPPSTWVGFTLAPRRVVFWRGHAEGPSNRIMYTSGEDGWSIERKAG